MKQITVLLALASPTLRAKIRSEVLMDPAVALLFDARTASEAVTQTRLHQPQIVLCDRGMAADGQLNAIAQQASVVSLLVLVTLGDESGGVRVPVPIAGIISHNRRPGELADRLQAIVDAPSSFIEPTMRLEKHLAPPSERLQLESIPYDAGRIPSLPRSGRLTWLSDQAQTSSPAPTGTQELCKRSFLKSALDQEPGTDD